MSSSDSEEFESADESFDEDAKNVKSAKKIETKKVQEKPTIAVKNVPQDDVRKDDEVKMEARVEEVFEEVEKNVEEDIVKAMEEIVKEEREEIARQQQIDEKNTAEIESCENAKLAKKKVETECKKSEHSSPDLQDEGWEFDDWPAEEEAVKIEEVPKVLKTNEEEKDEWDFEDWGEEDPVAAPATQTPKTSARVTNQTSGSVTQSAASGPILQNISNVSEQKISGVFDKLSGEGGKSSAWKPWGWISTATESVASITTNVSKGISNVIESGIGVPDPEELAKQQQEHERRIAEQIPTPEEGGVEYSTDAASDESITLGRIVSGVTNISNRVITGGLDTLEGIGKKTMTILQENDPLLLNKRKMLGLDSAGERPVLSQMLREAKQKTEETERNLKVMQKHLYKKQIHFETLFDDYHGLVHLEALEMLSKQSSLKLQSLMAPLSGKALQELQETLSEIRELCELPDQDSEEEADGLHTTEELAEKIKSATEDLGVPVDVKELLSCWQENSDWLSNVEELHTSQEIHDKALRCLAQTTALAVHKMHKLAEILLILDHHSTANEADSLVQLTTTLCWHLSGIATRFSDKISETGNTDESSSLITSIFIEGSNSTSYVQKTFQLFIPILQIGAA